MSRSAERVVTLAAALLPRASRDRYREQWTGELRDAASLDIPRAEIAKGALAVAARINRPMPAWVRATPPRLSFALALSAAVITLSQFASLVPVSDGITTSISGSIASSPLITWVILMPVAAFIMILAARRASGRERAAVTLLAVASYVPFLRGAIDSLAPWQWGGWLTFGTYTYAAGAILVGLALALVWREYGLFRIAASSERPVRRILRSGIAGLAVGIVVALCALNESASWQSRAVATWNETVTPATRAEYNEWLTGWAQGEDLVVNTISVWLTVGILAAVGIVLFGISRRATLLRVVLLATGASCCALVSFGGLIMFLKIMSFTVVATAPIDLVMFVGRLGILVVVVAAFALGGHRAEETSSAPLAPGHA